MSSELNFLWNFVSIYRYSANILDLTIYLLFDLNILHHAVKNFWDHTPVYWNFPENFNKIFSNIVGLFSYKSF